MTKFSIKRIIHAIHGRMPYEDLTKEEFAELVRRVDEAVAQCVREGRAPGTTTLQ